jgi:adenylate cyclase
MTDEELTLIIESLTTRAENTMSTLVCPHIRGKSRANLQYFKHLGGFSSVLAALEQATRTDPRLIVHALALMNGAL